MRAAAEQCLAAKDTRGAWLAVSDWVAQAPGDPAARLALARVAADLHAPALVIAQARRGLNAHPDAAQAQALLLLKAQAHLQVGEGAAAWTAFSHLLEVRGGNHELRTLAERARWQVHAQLNSRALWERLLADAETTATAPQAGVGDLLRLARWLAQAGQDERAFAELRTALSRWPQEVQVRDALADLLLNREPVLNEAGDSQRDDFRFAHDADRALVAAGAGGLASSALLGRWAIPPEATAAKTDPLTPQAAKQRLAEFHAALAAYATVSATALPALHAGVEAGRAAAGRTDAALDAAVLSAWKTRMGATQRNLEQALGTLHAARNTALNLSFGVRDTLTRVAAQTPAATAQALQDTAAVFAAEQVPLEGDTPVSEADTAFETVTGELITVQRAYEAGSARQALLALAQTGQPAAVLTASADLFSWGVVTPEVWRLRFAAAEQLNDAHEMLASGANAFTGEWLADGAALDRQLPDATTALLARLTALIGEADHALTEAATAWQAHDAARAFAALDHALAIDPANVHAWHERWRWSEASRQDEAALAALRTWWQLDDATDADLPPATSTAARGGNWDLLLSAADQRLLADPLDVDAHLMRATAALATRRWALVKAETPLLTATQAYASGALITGMLEGVWSGNDAALPPRIVSTIGTVLEAPGVRVWRDYQREHDQPGVTASDPASDLAKDPAGMHHERLAGRLTPEAYHERARGTAEEALAGWLEATLARRAGRNAAATQALSTAAADARLPLPFRAAAAAWVLFDSERKPVAALRAGDPWHGSLDQRDSKPLPIAPGQEVVVGEAVALARWPAGDPVCVRGILGSAAQLQRTAEAQAGGAADDPAHPAAERLFVVRDTLLAGDWSIATPVIADLTECSFSPQTPVAFSGSARLVDCTAGALALTLPAGSSAEWRGVRGDISSASISGTWRCRADDLAFLAAPIIAADGVWNLADCAVAGRIVPAIAAGGQAAWDGVRGDAITTWPAQLPAGLLLTGCTVTAPVATPTAAVLPLPAPHRDSRVLALPTAEAVVHHATTFDELQSALDATQPGEIWELARGSYDTHAPLIIPPGVAVRGNGSTISSYGTCPLHAKGAGARSVSGFSIGAQGNQTWRTAVSLSDGAWLALQDTRLWGFRDSTHVGFALTADCRLRLEGRSGTDGAPEIDPRATVDACTMLPGAADALRATITHHARDQLWALAAGDFPRMWASGKHSAAARQLADTMYLLANATELSSADFTVGLYGILQPLLRQAPAEAPPVLMAADYHCDRATEARLLDPLFKPYLATYRQGLEEAVTNHASLDDVYTFGMAFPVGSPDHEAAMDALSRGLTVAQARQEIADQTRQQAVIAEQWRKANTFKPIPVQAPVEEEWTPRPAHSGYDSGSAWGSSSSSWGSSGGPSEAQRMSNYGQKLDDRLDRVVRGY